MKARCAPGDRCIVLAEVAGCECNIGALVTVTESYLMLVPGMGWRPVWKFKDASRPLLIGPPSTFGKVLPGTERFWITSSFEHEAHRCPAYDDAHLLPIHGEGEILLDEVQEVITA